MTVPVSLRLACQALGGCAIASRARGLASLALESCVVAVEAERAACNARVAYQVGDRRVGVAGKAGVGVVVGACEACAVARGAVPVLVQEQAVGAPDVALGLVEDRGRGQRVA